MDDIIEFILNVWWIRFQASKTFLKFAAVGSLGVVVNLGLFLLLYLGSLIWVFTETFVGFWEIRACASRDWASARLASCCRTPGGSPPKKKCPKHDSNMRPAD